MTLALNSPTSIYQPEEVRGVDFSRMPKHVAIIPDGNRRWAMRRLLNPHQGHRQGADNLINILKGAKELSVKTLTIYTFSTENWLRSSWEVTSILKLISEYLYEYCEEMIANGTRLWTIGDLSKLPENMQKTVSDVCTATEKCSDLDLVLALNYGARDEIKRAFVSMIEDYDNHQFLKNEISEDLISRYLDTHRWGDPDLLIRTSGESRISNFLLWQISYTEIYTTDVYWPDFTPEHFLEALKSYQHRQRRGGS